MSKPWESPGFSRGGAVNEMTFDEWWVREMKKAGAGSNMRRESIFYSIAARAWEAAVKQERMSCALACEVHAAAVQGPNNGTPWSACHECADAIRAR